jgi:hypothetical protein
MKDLGGLIEIFDNLLSGGFTRVISSLRFDRDCSMIDAE